MKIHRNEYLRTYKVGTDWTLTYLKPPNYILQKILLVTFAIVIFLMATT